MTHPGGYSYLSFLTDYGGMDGFVAICHGQMLSRAPAARVLDITHEIVPGDIQRGATVLADTVPELPSAVHVGVVDPGVGTTRGNIAVSAGGHVLIGPDNGLLMWAADALGGADACYALTNTAYWRHPVSATFHGRDIYAPVGGALAAGVPLDAVGAKLSDPVRLPEPRHEVATGIAKSEVRAIDRFGNCQLTLVAEDLVRMGAQPGVDSLFIGAHGTRWTVPIGVTFASVSLGEPLVLVDSASRVAIAENGDNAAKQFGLVVGDTVELSTG